MWIFVEHNTKDKHEVMLVPTPHPPDTVVKKTTMKYVWIAVYTVFKLFGPLKFF